MNRGTCFVTGAAGFIGSHLVDRLLGSGYRVLGADNMALGRRENLGLALANRNFTFRDLDVNDAPATVRFLKESGPVDLVWHLAANSDIPAGCKDPEVDLRMTFFTTFNTLKAMQELGIRQIAFASTSAIYGDQDKELSEDSGPLIPISNYGAMKLASEAVISAALERFLERAWIFRFPNVVGSRATHGVIRDFILKLRRSPRELEVLGDGCQEKPYLHVSELVDAMVFLADKQRERFNVFNIAPENATTVRYIAETVVGLAAPGAAIRYTGGAKGWPGDVPKFRYSIARLKAAGWQPRMTSNQAVELAVRENLKINSSE